MLQNVSCHLGQRSISMYSTNSDGGVADSQWVGEEG
jgi:hypothetical protein